MEDIMKTVRLTPRQVLRVFFETCCAVAHMHSQNPPIIHRDLKVSIYIDVPRSLLYVQQYIV